MASKKKRGGKNKTSCKKKLVLLLKFGNWIICFMLLIYIPSKLLVGLLPQNRDVVPSKTFRMTLEFTGNELRRKINNYTPVIDGYVLYGSDSPEEMEPVELNISLSVPKSAISKLLHLPEEPINHRLCFSTNSYYQGKNGNFPLRKQSLRIMLNDRPVFEVLKEECINDFSSGTTLIGAGPGPIFIDEITEGFNRVGMISFSGSNIQLDQSQKSGSGIIFNYSEEEEGSVKLNGQTFKGKIVDAGDGKFNMVLDAADKNLISVVESIQELHIEAKPVKIELFILGLVLLTGWWAIVLSFIKSMQQVWKTIFVPFL